MRRQIVRQIKAVELNADQMHRECKLVGVQHSILVQVRQFPHFAEDRVRKSRLDELRLCDGAGDLAVDWTEPLKDLVIFVAIP